MAKFVINIEEQLTKGFERILHALENKVKTAGATSSETKEEFERTEKEVRNTAPQTSKTHT